MIEGGPDMGTEMRMGPDMTNVNWEMLKMDPNDVFNKFDSDSND